jgi:lipocalin
VIGNNTKYMWILAREPNLDSVVLKDLLNTASKLGFATAELVYPQAQGAGSV